MASEVALVTVFAPDRIGLVASIADYLFGAGVNLRDTLFAALGQGAEFTAVCELPSGITAKKIESGLNALPELAEAQVRVVPYRFDPDSPTLGRVTHRITISGGDQLGLVARLSEIFAQYQANIVRLEARKLGPEDGGLYVTRFAVCIPPGMIDPCLATVGNTAGTLGLTSAVEQGAL